MLNVELKTANDFGGLRKRKKNSSWETFRSPIQREVVLESVGGAPEAHSPRSYF